MAGGAHLNLVGEDRVSSFDLGVWYSDAAMDVMQASAVYNHINYDWVVVERRPEFDAFLSELTARFPDLRSPSEPPVSPDAPPDAFLKTLDDLKTPPSEAQIRQMQSLEPPPDDSPWQDTLEPTGSTITLSINWDRVEETMPVIYQLAARHGLMVYDPQSNTLTVPPQIPRSGTSEIVQAHLKMHISGKTPDLDVVLTLDGKVVAHNAVANRVQAHAQAREAAIKNHLAVYEAADPAIVIQAVQFVPVEANDPSMPTLGNLPQSSGLQIFRMVVPGVNKP
jgi:hypothetical protein